MNFVCASEREYCFLEVVEGVAEVGEVEYGDREFLSQCATRRRKLSHTWLACAQVKTLKITATFIWTAIRNTIHTLTLITIAWKQ